MNAQVNPSEYGISMDVPANDYHRRELGVVSNSVLKILRDKTPAHYKAWIDADDDGNDSPAMRFGRTYHCAVLEPDLFATQYAVAPHFGDLRTKIAKESRDAWQDEHTGCEMLSQDDGDRIAGMLAALHAHPVAAGIIRSKTARREVTMRWLDARTGLTCKARADWWEPGKFFMDLKTTEDASPAKFARSIHDYGYHAQAALYCDGANALGERIGHYLILAQEKTAPYAVAVYHIDSHTESRGFELIQHGMDIMAECVESGKWPAYGDGITEISVPAWALQDRAP